MKSEVIENYVYSEQDALWGLTHAQSKWVREQQATGIDHRFVTGMIRAFQALNAGDIK